ncbi:MAG: hypothetical protein A3D53_01240 [Candidatus Magasanikbacteria bacterium RIFCSPHIGHO2_02_FULL_45_10]|uniref:Glycosyl transferase family 1 n=2 Tax=Candidatus Magasanikiibacteriota TaxID=1752731 RepID=A0A1F6MAC1_9BACT|nr:MAG: hypothetical protein A3D53_01240 [Candidatus Magasanikbacteria bacterium RIFCSPHIGHO2_02_FULL_45_10]
MKIGIDARLYGPKQGGLGRYIQQLILNLEKLDLDHEFVIFLRRENWDEYSPTNPRFIKVLADIPWYGWKEQFLLPNLIDRQKIDLMHFPHWNVPIFYRRPFVVTIHDLLLLHFPTRRASSLNAPTYWIKNNVFKIVIKHAIKQARCIITPSDYTKKDIQNTFHRAAEDITVLHQGPTAFPENSRASITPYGIRQPFVMYVGVAYPHKNLSFLLKAWALFKKTYHTDHQLVLVGKENYFYQQLLSSDVWKKCPDVCHTGFVPDDDLPKIYQSASLYVMPSLYEGYALPCLEAMRYKLPVVSSQATCLPEVLKGAALYFNPFDTNSLVETIHRGLTDMPLRETIISAGQKLLTNYSAKTLAEKTLAIYQKTVDNI